MSDINLLPLCSPSMTQTIKWCCRQWSWRGRWRCISGWSTGTASESVAMLVNLSTFRVEPGVKIVDWEFLSLRWFLIRFQRLPGEWGDQNWNNLHLQWVDYFDIMWFLWWCAVQGSKTRKCICDLLRWSFWPGLTACCWLIFFRHWVEIRADQQSKLWQGNRSPESKVRWYVFAQNKTHLWASF